MHKFTILPLLFLGAVCAARADEAGRPVRALAQAHGVFDQSPDAQNIPLYTPSILRLDSGRLVGASERAVQWKKSGKPNAGIQTSDDGGKTWTLRAEATMTHGRLFKAGKSVYYMGHSDDLKIMRSDDDALTWSEPVRLTQGQFWHATAANTWHANGNVYLVMERVTSKEIKSFYVGLLAPVLLRAKESADLTRPESWTFASELVFADIIPGYRQNNLQMDFFGVPFFGQTYPDLNFVAPKRPMHPIGWLEANVVQITDPDHYWHDPKGKTFHLFMRAHTGGTGYAAMAKVTENDDGTMTTSLEKVPSGKTQLFLPFPGGQMRFHITYDPRTRLYWLLGTQATDSMSRLETLDAKRFELPSNERQRLVLHYSKNMVDWCFAGLVAVGPKNVGSRHYASMDIDGDDLVILSRSGDEHAKTAHNGNIITFHRIKNFRELVY